MSTTTYNGWTNYETWAVKLWMDNEEPSYREWTERTREAWDSADASNAFGITFTRSQNARRTLAAQIKDAHEEGAQLACDTAGVFSDLLGAALSEVDWDEIADSLLDTMNEGLNLDTDEAETARYERR